MTLIDRAIELVPANRELYDTRGRIYAKQGQWKKAIGDFEKALVGNIRDKPSLHAQLAEAYRQCGDEELAELHQRKSKTNEQPDAILTDTSE